MMMTHGFSAFYWAKTSFASPFNATTLSSVAGILFLFSLTEAKGMACFKRRWVSSVFVVAWV